MSWLSKILIIFAASIFAAGALLLAIYPYRPSGTLGWLILLAVALPLYLSLEFLGSLAFSERVESRLGSSPLRIIYGVGVMLIFVAVGFVALSMGGKFFDTWGT